MRSCRNQLIVICGFITSFVILPIHSAAIPLTQIKGFSQLSDKKKQLARRALRQIKGYYGCVETLERCMAASSPHKTARRVARYVIFLAGKGLTVDQIAQVIELRKKSVHPARRFTINTSQCPRIGDAKAPVVIVEYADFQCPHCAHVNPLLERAVRSFKGRVVLYFKPYPLRFSGPRLLCAKATLAADRQGKAWEMIDRLFKNRDAHTDKGVETIARQIGLKVDRFRAAMKDINLLKQIERNKIEGLRFGIKGTPAIFINGKKYRLRKDEQHFKDLIAEELELLD